VKNTNPLSIAMHPPRPNILAFLSLITTSLASNVYYPPADSLLTCSVEEGYADCPSGKLAGGADDEYSLTIGDCGCKAIPSNWPSVCVIVAQKGQNVDFYSGNNCDGKYMWGFPNPGTFVWCGWQSFGSNSQYITC
jgi:hypothetical protein